MLRKTNPQQKNAHLKSSFSKEPNQFQLGQIYRLFSPKNIIRSKAPQSKKQQDQSILELVFHHPNILFISPNLEDKEKKDLQIEQQYRIIKDIVDRKKKFHSMKGTIDRKFLDKNRQGEASRKPKITQNGFESERNQQNKHFDFGLDSSKSHKDTLFSTLNTFKRSAKTASSNYRVRSSANIEQAHHIGPQLIYNDLSCRLDMQKDNAILRRKSKRNYKKIVITGLKDKKLGMYIKFEKEFTKYFQKKSSLV